LYEIWLTSLYSHIYELSSLLSIFLSGIGLDVNQQDRKERVMLQRRKKWKDQAASDIFNIQNWEESDIPCCTNGGNVQWNYNITLISPTPFLYFTLWKTPKVAFLKTLHAVKNPLELF
jgi:hypothetical protein